MQESEAMESPELDKEASAFLEMAREVRSALTRREEVVGPFRRRYDQSLDDPRILPDKRVQIATMFLRASHKADHVYEDCLDRAREGFRRSMNGDQASD